jgi:UDP-N-acetyl-D-glucosamine dehydrogenase
MTLWPSWRFGTVSSGEAAKGSGNRNVSSSLAEKIASRDAVVGVIGMGYVGVPLAMAFRKAGFPVLAFDVDEERVAALNRGDDYIRHLDSGEVLKRSPGIFEATADFARVRQADAIILCVPTPLTQSREPDLSHVTQTAEGIAPHLRRGQLVILESTTYPGTTDEVLVPILQKSGLEVGNGLYVAYSPEREDPGDPSRSTGHIPKVVGAVDNESLHLASLLYEAVVPRVVRVSSARVAEMAKLLENVYRSVNIALVNEIKVLAQRMGINIWEVIEAASTKPFGFQAFYPGPGLGGHCIPIDPFYLAWKARQYEVPTRFIELAGEISRQMPVYVAGRIVEALNGRGRCVKHARVLLLGVAYKPDVDDWRESPAVRIAQLLQDLDADVVFYDPYIHSFPAPKDSRLHGQPTWVDLTRENLSQADCVVIVTNHSEVDYQFVLDHAVLVVDTRNATGKLPRGQEKVVRA